LPSRTEVGTDDVTGTVVVAHPIWSVYADAIVV
jgi:hypothetical protein